MSASCGTSTGIVITVDAPDARLRGDETGWITAGAFTQLLTFVCETTKVSDKLPAFCKRKDIFVHSPGSTFLSIGVDSTAFEKSKVTEISEILIVEGPDNAPVT
jgi:hypothetical protein